MYRGKYKGDVVAIKCLKPAWFQSESAKVEFVRELELLYSLKHVNIIRVYGGTNELDSSKKLRAWIVMELINTKLSQAFDDRAKYGITEPIAINIVYQIASALAFLHSQTPAIHHCDLKPGNVLLTDVYVVKLIDFGLAYLRKSGSTRMETSVRTAGRGTAGYMVGQCAELKDMLS